MRALSTFIRPLLPTKLGAVSLPVDSFACLAAGEPPASTQWRPRRYMRRAAALYRLLERRIRHRAALRQLQALDAATLRDLGLARSEIGSVFAESVGLAPSTRRRRAERESHPWAGGAGCQLI